jgi:hypothetical protein
LESLFKLGLDPSWVVLQIPHRVLNILCFNRNIQVTWDGGSL